MRFPKSSTAHAVSAMIANSISTSGRPHCALRALQNSENPAFNLGYLALMWFKLGAEELSEAVITVRPPQPFGGCKGVLLVGRSPCAWETPAPKRRINLRDHRAIGRHVPIIEGPEMPVVFGVLPDVAQPRNACVSRLRYHPFTSKWNTDLAVRARNSATRRQRGLPERDAPFPMLRSRTKSTKCPRRLANGAGNHQESRASRAATRAARSIASEMKSHGRCPRALAVLRRAFQPATEQRPGESSIYEDCVVARLPAERSSGRLRKRVDPSDSTRLSVRPSSRCRCIVGMRSSCRKLKLVIPLILPCLI
jgi:hypothetical protein